MSERGGGAQEAFVVHTQSSRRAFPKIAGTVTIVPSPGWGCSGGGRYMM